MIALFLAINSTGKSQFAENSVEKGLILLNEKSDDTPFSLMGEWKFYWNEFLTDSSESLSSHYNNNQSEFINFNSRWSSYTGVTRFQGVNHGYASYLVRIESQSPKKLALKIPPMPLSYKVYYQEDGAQIKKLAELGRLSRVKNEGGETREDRLVDLGTVSGGFLLFEASNYKHADVRMANVPILGDFEVLHDREKSELSANYFINGINFSIFLLFFFQCFYRRNDKASLFLSLMALTFISFGLTISGEIFAFLPSLIVSREDVGITLEYLSLALGGMGYLGYCFYSSNTVLSKFVASILGLGVLLAVLTLIMATTELSRIPFIFQVFLLVCLAVGFSYDLRRALVERSARVAIVGHSVLFAAVFLDILANYDLIEQVAYITQTASVIFTFVLSQGVSVANAETFNNEKDLSRSLKMEVDRQTESLKKKTIESRNFLRVVTHDVRNPLTVVQGCLELLLSRHERLSKDKLVSFLNKANTASNQINNILSHAREMDAISAGKSELKLASVNVKNALETMNTTFNQKLDEKKVTLRIAGDISPSLEVLAEETTLCHNVLANIVSNSIKFSNEGAEIEIVVEDSDEEVLIRISDHGIGIPTSLKDKLFDPFAKTTRKGTSGEAGTGFGMPIVKTYMDHYHGSIEVESVTADEDPDHSGTSFSLHFKKGA